MLRELDVPVADLPIVVVPGGPLLRNPGSRELLDALGMSGTGRHRSARRVRSAGRGRAVPAAWRPPCTARRREWRRSWPRTPRWAARREPRPGSRTSWASPRACPARSWRRARRLQAQKFGVRIKLAAKAVSLSSDAGVHRVSFDDGDVITAKSVIIATGARYNRLPLDRLAEFEGVGVYYAATQMEAQACRDRPGRHRGRRQLRRPGRAVPEPQQRRGSHHHPGRDA